MHTWTRRLLARSHSIQPLHEPLQDPLHFVPTSLVAEPPWESTYVMVDSLTSTTLSACKY
jgi:hypothetical protein